MSREEQVQGYSPAAQERAAEAFCVAQGGEIDRAWTPKGQEEAT